VIIYFINGNADPYVRHGDGNAGRSPPLHWSSSSVWPSRRLSSRGRLSPPKVPDKGRAARYAPPVRRFRAARPGNPGDARRTSIPCQRHHGGSERIARSSRHYGPTRGRPPGEKRPMPENRDRPPTEPRVALKAVAAASMFASPPRGRRAPRTTDQWPPRHAQTAAEAPFPPRPGLISR
jgi:hypothetical protein